MQWYECQSCLNEFRVISDSDDYVDYCPFCGSEDISKTAGEVDEEEED